MNVHRFAAVRSCVALATLACFAAPVWSKGKDAQSLRCDGTGQSLTPPQVVDAQFAAFNGRDLEGFVACYSDDVSMVDLSGRNPVIKGKAALRQAFAYLATSRKGVGVEIVERVVNGPVVIDKERPVGGHPGKPLPDLIAVYEVRAGKIAQVWFPPSH